MKRMQNIQFTSPEADRKVMLPASFIVMALLWLLCITVLVFIAPAAWTDEKFAWTSKLGVAIVVLSFLSLLVIPVQLLGYIRKMRRLFR